MPARGLWIKNSGKPQGSVRPPHGQRRSWAVDFRAKSVKKWKSGFPDRARAKEWRRRESNKHGLTRNRIRRKVGHPGVREMMIHRRGQPWTGDLATFSARDLPIVLAHIGSWHFTRDGYVAAVIAGKQTKVCNLLRPPPPGKVNDHINRVYSDDRRPNLRFVTQKDNARNKKKQSNNTSGENGIYEEHSARCHSYDHANAKRFSPRGPSTTKPAGRDLWKEAQTLRDRLGAKTKQGRIPKICYHARWCVDICRRSPDGGEKTLSFDPDDAVDRKRAFQEAVVYRDMLQARCNSTNGKPATHT